MALCAACALLCSWGVEKKTASQCGEAKNSPILSSEMDAIRCHKPSKLGLPHLKQNHPIMPRSKKKTSVMHGQPAVQWNDTKWYEFCPWYKPSLKVPHYSVSHIVISSMMFKKNEAELWPVLLILLLEVVGWKRKDSTEILLAFLRRKNTTCQVRSASLARPPFGVYNIIIVGFVCHGH